MAVVGGGRGGRWEDGEGGGGGPGGEGRIGAVPPPPPPWQRLCLQPPQPINQKQIIILQFSQIRTQKADYMKVGCVPRFPAQGCTKEGADESGWFIKFCSVNCLGKVKMNERGREGCI